MVVRVVLPLALVRLFPECDGETSVKADDVRGVILALDARWPGMWDRLCDSTPAIRRHINVFVSGERMRLDTPVPDGAEVFVMTAISGG